MEKWIIFESTGEVYNKKDICKGCTFENNSPTEIGRYDSEEEMLAELANHKAYIRYTPYNGIIYDVTEYYGQLWEIDEDGFLDDYVDGDYFSELDERVKEKCNDDSDCTFEGIRYE